MPAFLWHPQALLGGEKGQDTPKQTVSEPERQKGTFYFSAASGPK